LNWYWSLKELDKVKKNGYKAFSTFSGGGGTCMGMKLAGFDIIAINEVDKKQVDKYIRNLGKPKYVFDEPIQNLLEKDLPEELYDIDVFEGSPPCTLFSSANVKADERKGKKIKYREGNIEQVIDDLFFITIDLIKELQPKIVVLENVKGLLFKKNKYYVDKIYKKLNNAGYNTSHYLLNSMYMGVPQKRERVFFIATRKDLPKFKENMEFDKKPIPIKEIINKIGEEKLLYQLTNQMEQLIKHMVDNDKDFADIYYRLHNKRALFNHKIVSLNDVCPTIRGGDMTICVREYKKRLTKEAKILCSSFPYDYDFRDKIEYTIGMSVPPLMAYNVFKKVENYLNKITKG